MRARTARLLAALATLGALCAAAQVPTSISRTVPQAPGEAVVVDVGNMQVFVANASLDRVTILDANGAVLGTFPTGKTPRHIGYDGNGRVFVSNDGDQTLTVRTPTSVANLPIGGAGPMVVTSTKVYVLRQGNNGEVAVVDPQTLSWYAIDTGSHTPFDLAINATGTRLFVSHTLSGDVRSIDLTSSSDHPPSVGIQVAGQPGPITYNAFNDKVYVLSDDARGPIVEIDAKTNVGTPITMPGHGQGPRVVKALSRTLFAGFANELVVMDLASRILTFIPTAEVRAIYTDSFTQLAFVLDAANVLRVIDPRTMRVDSVSLGTPSFDVQFIARNCTAYVAGAVTTLVSTACSEAQAERFNAQGLWWVPEESGWGLNIAHQGSTLFGTWFTYDAAGQPMWLVMSNGTQVSGNFYEGTLYRTAGPAFNASAFDAGRVTRTPVGTLRVTVAGPNTARIDATVDGVAIGKSITKQVFASPVPVCGANVAPGALPNYQDLWWNPAESGWGLNIAHQGDVLFVTWFTYDTDGKALWLVGSDLRKTGNATYSGTLYRTVGPPVNASPWDPAKVSRIPAGSATLVFADEANATFAYTVSGVSGSKSITREIFATPRTGCR